MGIQTTAKRFLGKFYFWLFAPVLLFALVLPAQAIDLGGDWTAHGRLRQYFSWNLDNVPVTKPRNDEWDMAMNRQSFFLQLQGPTGPLSWTFRGRVVHEFMTNYEEELEDLTARVPGNQADFPGEYNQAVIRELYFDYSPIDRLWMRIGRQQVVWGQTDFFHATDVIQGYDLRWRKFLNPSSQEWRKAQIMANFKIRFPKLNGGLQLLVEPGLGRDDWHGNTDPTFGGRWANSASHGFNLASTVQGGAANINYEYNNHGIHADTDDPHYGLRWKGSTFLFGTTITYALNYYHGQAGFFSDPILITDPTAGGLQFILPETDTVGGSASGFIPVLNAIYRVEVAYTPDRPLSTAKPMSVPWSKKPLANQIVKNDAYNFVIGLDKPLRLMDLLGTSNASMLSLQLFDWYIPGINENDKIYRFDGSGFWDTHNMVATGIFSNPFFNGDVNLTFVGLADLTEGGGMFIPSVEYEYKRHWRFKLEADLAFGGNYTDPKAGFPPDPASLFGALHYDDRLMTRITYQF